jgi:hypothetical protein
MEIWLFTNLTISSLQYNSQEGWDRGTDCARGRVMSVFDDRQLIMGFPGTMVGGLRRMQNSTVNAETTIYTCLVRQNSIPTSNLGEKYIAPCAWGLDR